MSKLLGPSEQPSPSTSMNSCRLARGQLVTNLEHVHLLMVGIGIKGKRPDARSPAFRPFRAVPAPHVRARPAPIRPLGLLDQARHHPGLGLGDRPALGDLDHVAQLALVLLVVSVVLARAGNDLAVQLVLGAALDQHGDGLGALVADDLADQRAGVLRRRCGRLLVCGLSLIWRPLASSSRPGWSWRGRCRAASCPACVWLFSCCVAFCMRRPKWALSRSATSFCRPATSLPRSSDAFMVFSPVGRQAPTWRATKVVRSGSLAEASWNASRASSSGTPLIS